MNYKTLNNYYYYDKEIDYGSFSIVYRGYRLVDRKPVAIKKLIKSIDEKYINQEIDIMKKLNHENILLVLYPEYNIFYTPFK